jgi:glycosidase
MIGPERMHSSMNYYLADALAYYLKYKDATRLAYVIRDIKAEYPKCTIDTLMNYTSTHDISRIMTLLATKQFDTYDKFRELPRDLQQKIFDSLREIGFHDDDIHALFNGLVDLSYTDYHRLMWMLGEKGVPIETVNYLKTILSFSPFLRHGEYAKSIVEEIKNDYQYTKDYKLTEREYKMARDKLEAYVFFLYSWPGIVSIFYGDEIGMQGLNNLANRRPYPWGKEDKELLEYFRKMGMYRKKNPFLRTADSNIVELNNELVTFERIAPSDQLFVAINNTDESRDFYIPEEYRDGKEILTLKKSKKEVLHPYGGIVIKK